MIDHVVVGAAALSAAVWLFLLVFRGGFWKADQRLDAPAGDGGEWPEVVCVIPARNEAPTIGTTVASLFGQDYPGRLSVVVVDDGSDDGTAGAARAAASDTPDRGLVVVGNAILPAGWVGKMWAVNRGLEAARDAAAAARYVLLTDADIEHDAGNLRRLVARAERDGTARVSLMVRLRCDSGWERLLIPAFVFFFQKLYPFPWVNDPARSTAAAGGGCMLVHRSALDRIGGVSGIRDQVIDDCALARQVKKDAAIWLGLTASTRSLRVYTALSGIWDMVARSAFIQLRRSLLLLAGTVVGMAVVYAVPPIALVVSGVSGDAVGLLAGALAWTLMSVAYGPTAQLHGRPWWWGVTLPLAAILYTAMTIDSARRHLTGRGAAWKGRTYGGREAGHG